MISLTDAVLSAQTQCTGSCWRIRLREMIPASTMIAKGYFPKELPPAFSTVALSKAYVASPSALEGKKSPTETTKHNLSVGGRRRRRLEIPNPRSFLRLAKVLEENSGLIEKHLSGDVDGLPSLSSPVSNSKMRRAVSPSFRARDRGEKRASSRKGRRYVLFADISHFYHSIYTHSIPWALHSKSAAKAQKGKTDGDQIDKAIQGCSHGQTAGVPIGPDSSFLAAEIVLAAVDRSFIESGVQANGFRYFDDYELAFRTQSEAEEARGELERALAEYELTLNPAKTRVVELPHALKPAWTRALHAAQLRDSSSVALQNDLVDLFSIAFEEADYSMAAIRYALKKCESAKLDGKSWRLFQDLTLNAVSAAPATLPVALSLWQRKSLEVGVGLDVEGMADVVSSIIQSAAPLQNTMDVSWALWTAVKLDIPIDSSAAVQLGTVRDDIVAILSFDATARGLFCGGAPSLDVWTEMASSSGALESRHWLLAYEAATRDWIPEAGESVSSDPFFKELEKREVTFYSSPEPDAISPDNEDLQTPDGDDLYD